MKIAVMAAMVAAAFVGSAMAEEPGKPVPKESPGNWITDNDYPSSEMSKGVTGTTGVSLLVGTKGEVKDCHVNASSGSETLDATACALLKVRGAFFSAKDGKGRKVESIYATRVQWVLPTGMPIAAPGTQSVTVFVDISSEGVVEKCTVEQMGDFVLPSDPCVQFPVGRKGAAFTGPDGTAIPVRMTERMTREFQPR